MYSLKNCNFFFQDLALVERDALSGIKGRDFDSACGLTETGALIVWHASPILEEMVAHNQLDSKQDPESFRLPATSDIENQRQGPTAQMTNISFMVESSSSARPTVQDDENLRGDFLTLINEVNTFLTEVIIEAASMAFLFSNMNTRVTQESWEGMMPT